MTDIKKLLRENIASLKPYSSARHEFTGRGEVYLDANESPFESELNRYPDPLQIEVKERIGQLNDLEPKQIFLGNGSDEAIDLLIRAFCEPNRDSILIFPPTYGMYKVSADINAVQAVKAALNTDFQLNRQAVRHALNGSRVKLIFACSPNNPTGNRLNEEDIDWLLNLENKIIILDEAYADFAQPSISIASRLNKHPNLVILRTFSKAWGMAGARLGIAFASTTIIEILNRIKPPYNINSLTQTAVLDAINNPGMTLKRIELVIGERHRCARLLNEIEVVEHIFPSDANFLLVKFRDAEYIFRKLISKGIIVRDRQSEIPGCLRITIGTPDENDKLLYALNNLS